MHNLMKPIILLLLPMLGGCAFTKALFFQSDQNSFHLKDAKATLFAFPDDGSGCPSSKAEFIAAAPVFAALAQVAMNVAASEISDYLKKVEKEFNAAYKGTLNLDGYYRVTITRPNDSAEFSISELRNNAKCIMVKRTFDEGNPTFSETEVEKKDLAFWWAGQIQESVSGTAEKFRTDKILLRRAAARTDAASRKVDVSVQLKIDAISLNEKGTPAPVTVADKILAFPGLTTPKDPTASEPTAFPVGKAGAGSNASGESSWFPKVPFNSKDLEQCIARAKLHPDLLNSVCLVSPVTISFLVTETGSGSAEFGNLAKEIDDNKKTLGDALNKALADGINKKAGTK